MLFESFLTPRVPDAFRFELDDGTPVLVRKLRPEDAPRLQQGYARLSQLARRRRFFDQMTELSDEQARQLTQLDHIDQSAWGCANLDKPDEPGVGIARYSRVNGEPDGAEVAIVIVDDYQGRGAGMLLHACLHLTAWRAGIRRFHFDVLSDNERFIQQLKSLGAQFEGRAENIDRWVLPVYHRPRDVPRHTSNGRRFGRLLLRLAKAQPDAA